MNKSSDLTAETVMAAHQLQVPHLRVKLQFQA